ncbi:lamin tail domain-containing protein [Hymenobacter sp. NST-14]|uniref:lamin tail domain-containing protein n=1 Tax=Hymenobacter piscis TaxID=2839984 RepID=UPI001C033D1E|nr:lamin tail domain-containing protein [Hymenobacter piscis]MBT9394951.1 lamin tail domain-containing protein [Hymenobacter piscis]
MKHFLLWVLLLSSFATRAQLTDTFADGDFTQNPAWTGDAASFRVNSAQQLQSSGPALTGTRLQLATPCQASTGTTWTFWANLKLATSSGNYADVWLLADRADLKATGTRGYFVRLGGTPDEVALFRKDATGSPAYVVNGTDGTLSSTTNNLVRVRVTRSVQDVWTLERDLSGGQNFTSEGTGPDATYQTSAFCGVVLTYSSANSQAFYFDDFQVTDATPPAAVQAAVAGPRTLDLTFNEAVGATQRPADYQLPGGPTVTTAQRDAANPALVHLTLATDLPPGAGTVEARGVADLYGNVAVGPLTAAFTFAGVLTEPGFYQLLITEIMARETPVVGLPASEYLEIHNPSATRTLDLAGVKLSKAGSTGNAAVFPAGATLLPGEYAVVCGSTRGAQFAAFGKVFALTNFPSLNNGGDELLLRAPGGRLLYAVHYLDSWYRDAAKQNGGWSLEMLDPANACAGAENWRASQDPSGGTPGRPNPVATSTPDTAPPTLQSVLVVSPTVLRLVFNETLDSARMANPIFYSLTPGVSLQRVQPVPFDFRAVELTLAAPLAVGQTYTAAVQSRTDCLGNSTGAAATVSFSLPVAPGFGQLLITEIMADETPAVGLPAAEYLEIYNPSMSQVLDLGGVQLLKPGSTGSAAVFPDSARLQPGEYAVVCGSTRGGLFAGFGKVFPLTNFPSLSNAADQLVLLGRTGRMLFEVTYSDNWYRDTRKQEGGWSLELVDAANFCGGSENWTASQDPSGGTPGRQNSVRTANPDRTAPALLRAVALTPTRVRLFFSEKLDSAAVANPALYTFAPAATVARVLPQGPDFRTLDLELSTALQPNQPLTLTVQRTTDCAGNASGPATAAPLALPAPVAAGDVVINEILFNPRPGGVDFVELLNRSAKYLNVEGWQLGSEKPDGSVDNKILNGGPYVLAPGQLLVLTTSPANLLSYYPSSAEPANLLALPSLASYPDDAGIVVVYSATGQLLDRFAYDKAMHLKLLDDLNGVSLERIRAAGPSTAGNFHSAASAVGYATPGRPNSQYQQDPGGDQIFRLEPEVFTPDEDGQQDFTTLNYTLDAPGYAASVTIYDAQGRLVRRLARNETLATTGFLQWDGLTDRGQKAAVGYYVLLIELFQPGTGQKREYRKTVVVGARP